MLSKQRKKKHMKTGYRCKRNVNRMMSSEKDYLMVVRGDRHLEEAFQCSEGSL